MCSYIKIDNLISVAKCKYNPILIVHRVRPLSRTRSMKLVSFETDIENIIFENILLFFYSSLEVNRKFTQRSQESRTVFNFFYFSFGHKCVMPHQPKKRLRSLPLDIHASPPVPAYPAVPRLCRAIDTPALYTSFLSTAWFRTQEMSGFFLPHSSATAHIRAEAPRLIPRCQWSFGGFLQPGLMPYSDRTKPRGVWQIK